MRLQLHASLASEKLQSSIETRVPPRVRTVSQLGLSFLVTFVDQLATRLSERNLFGNVRLIRALQPPIFEACLNFGG